ncbi:MAG TPA: class I SAM-dependent methyltransferase [Gaiellaceae bacterium]
MSASHHPVHVREQYAREDNLRARQALYAEVEGDDAQDVLRRSLREWRPRAVLEVGGGQGELAQWLTQELDAAVSFVDQSERMVELARARGIAAQVGDVQELPFEDDSFDTVVAAWMLYHVEDLDRGLAEIARVLRPGGGLFAVTNSITHLEELRSLIGYSQELLERFSRENGGEWLRRHFAAVERIDLELRVTVRERQRLVAYQQSLSIPSRPVPDDVEVPFVTHARTSLFFATT